jgi:methionine synthase II (cobalamin-independent)
MFFFATPALSDLRVSRSRAFAEGVATIFDIGGDITSPYREEISTSTESIMTDFAEDYVTVTEDYAEAVNKVVKNFEKE